MERPTVEEIKARLGAATLRPWRWADWSVYRGQREDPDERRVLEVSARPKEPQIYDPKEPSRPSLLHLEEPTSAMRNLADAELIEHAPTGLAMLLSEVDRLRLAVTDERHAEAIERAERRAHGGDRGRSPVATRTRTHPDESFAALAD